MKKKFFLLIIILSFHSCLNMNDAKSQVGYFENKKSFDKELVRHFPKKLTNNFLESYYGGNNNFRLKILIKSSDKYRKLKKQLIKNSKIVKKSTDSCFQIITVKEKQKISDFNELLPVPQEIISEFTSKNEKRKMLNNEIAFIDFKSEISEKDRLHKWENGYSKGYAFDDIEQTITYWLIIW